MTSIQTVRFLLVAVLHAVAIVAASNGQTFVGLVATMVLVFFAFTLANGTGDED